MTPRQRQRHREHRRRLIEDHGRALQEMLGAVAAEPLPADMLDQLRRLA